MNWRIDKNNKLRNIYLLKTYGITLDQYNELLERQGGGCAICGKTPKEEGRNLAVDHDHVTAEIRGVCCSYHNQRVIGRHRDAELLRRVADYIEGPHTGWFVPKNKRRRKKK